MKKSRTQKTKQRNVARDAFPMMPHEYTKEGFAECLHQRLYMLIHTPEEIAEDLELDRLQTIHSIDWEGGGLSRIAKSERRKAQDDLKAMSLGEYAMSLVGMYTSMLVDLDNIGEMLQERYANGEMADFETFMALGTNVKATA